MSLLVLHSYTLPELSDPVRSPSVRHPQPSVQFPFVLSLQFVLWHRLYCSYQYCVFQSVVKLLICAVYLPDCELLRLQTGCRCIGYCFTSTRTRFYLFWYTGTFVRSISAMVIIPNGVIHAVEIPVFGGRHFELATPRIPLTKPHHPRLILPCSQVEHPHSRIVALSIIRIERCFCSSSA